MNRLIGLNGDYPYILKCFENGGCPNAATEKCSECDHRTSAYAKLAQYEDTGFAPEEVAELAAVKAEGRLVVLPEIKKGKTLYWLWVDMIMPVIFKGVRGGCIDNGKYHVTCKMATKKPRTFIHRKKEFTYEAGDERWFYADDLGKEVFFSRAEAEAELGRRRA